MLVPATFLAGTFLSCTNDLDKVAAVEVPASGPDRVTLDAEYYFSDSGRVSNHLKAGRIEEYATAHDRRTELSDGLELEFFDTKGEVTSILTARRGTIMQDRHRMEAREQVVFTNRQGERLETELLIWSQDSDRVYTDHPVRVVRGRNIMHGKGLLANADFSKYRILHPSGELYMEPTDTLAPDAEAQ